MQRNEVSAMEKNGGGGPSLTYADVHMVLALLRGWPEGVVSLRYGELGVDVVIAPAGMTARSPDTTSAAGQHTVKSPAVGVFRLLAVTGPLRVGDAIGVVDAPGRSTPVIASAHGTPRSLVPDGSFVEFDQPLIALEPPHGNGHEG